VPLQRGLEPGHSIVAEGALAGDGTSAALGAEGYVAADGELTEDLIRAAGPNARAGTVQGADLLGAAGRPSTGALAADLESAALLALGAKLGVAVGSLLVVESLRPPGDGGGVAEHVAGSDVGLAEHVAGGYVELARIASAALNAQERSPGPGVSTRP
jgi:uridine phosphorylase